MEKFAVSEKKLAYNQYIIPLLRIYLERGKYTFTWRLVEEYSQKLYLSKPNKNRNNSNDYQEVNELKNSGVSIQCNATQQ